MSERAGLEALASAKFEPLSEAERRIVRSAQAGDIASCGASDSRKDTRNRPRQSAQWGEERRVRAAFLRWLCTCESAKEAIDVRGIRVFSAQIEEALDLSYIKLPFPLSFLSCSFLGECNLDVSEVPDVNLSGSSLPKLSAEYALIRGCLVLNDDFRSTGPVKLTGIRIGGNLECDAGKFVNPPRRGVQDSGSAIVLENAKIDGDVLMREGFFSKGAVWMIGAQIGGNLECWGGMFENPPKRRAAADKRVVALNAENVKVAGDVQLSTGFYATGQVSLDGAEIGGELNCEEGRFENPAILGNDDSAMALSLMRVRITGDVRLCSGFRSNGLVNLQTCEIGGTLDCDGAIIENPAESGNEDTGIALWGEGARVGVDIILRGGFEDTEGFLARGEVNFDGVEVGGVLDCSAGRFENPAIPDNENSGTSIRARSIRVTDSIFMGAGFFALGAVDLDGAQIEGILECENGTFESTKLEKTENSGVSINARFLIARDSVFLTNGFRASGSVKLDRAKITRRLEVNGGTLDNLDLTDSSAGSIVDDRNSWPAKEKLALSGFVYDRISGGPTNAASRLEWLGLQAEYSRQPYRQLAKVLKDGGDDEGSRRVSIEMERRSWEMRRRLMICPGQDGNKDGVFKKLSIRITDLLLRATIGYGYRSMRAVYGLLFLSLFGMFVYFMGFEAGSMLPTEKDNYALFVKSRTLQPGYERFHVIAYSLENAFPIVKLGIDEKWRPSPDGEAPAENSKWIAQSRARFVFSPGTLRWFRWAQIAAGWFLTTFFVIGVTGLSREK